MKWMTGTYLGASLGVAFQTASVACGQVIAGPVVNLTNGNTYYLLTSLSWLDSQVQALALGGNLATVNDAGENAWIVSQFANFGEPRALWIGLNDIALEGTFEWTSGEPVTYTNWGLTEPNNHQGIEDAVQIFSPSDFRFPRWNDAPDVMNPFGVTNGVVEINGVPEPCALVLAGLGMAVVFARRRCRNASHVANGDRED